MASNIPIYPKAIASWTNRVDEEDVVFANDPNSLAAEVISIEKTLGVMPQVEKNPILGNPVTYASVDARLSAIQQAQQLPVCSLYQVLHKVDNFFHPDGVLTTFQRVYDPFGMYNGSDIIIPVEGWYIIYSNQLWDWWDSGWNRHGLYFNGKSYLIDEVFARWDISSNVPGGYWWHRPMAASIVWQGLLKEGVRVSIYQENGTSDRFHNAGKISLKAACVSKVSGTFNNIFA